MFVCAVGFRLSLAYPFFNTGLEANPPRFIPNSRVSPGRRATWVLVKWPFMIQQVLNLIIAERQDD